MSNKKVNQYLTHAHRDIHNVVKSFSPSSNLFSLCVSVKRLAKHAYVESTISSRAFFILSGYEEKFYMSKRAAPYRQSTRSFCYKRKIKEYILVGPLRR